MMAPQDAGRWYKRATAVVCACNLITVFCIIYVLFITTSSSLSASRVARLEPQGPQSTVEEAVRYHASLRARLAVEPVELIKRVKEISEEFSRAEMRDPKSETARRKHAAAIFERLKQLKEANSTKHQQGTPCAIGNIISPRIVLAIEEWRKKKMASKKDSGAQNKRKEN